MRSFRLPFVALLLFAAIFAAMLLPAQPVLGKTKDDSPGQNTVIPAKQSVYSVVSVGGNTMISGTVQDIVVIFDGNLTIKKTAHIKGMIVVIGGDVHQEQGARLDDMIIHLSFNNRTANSLLLGVTLVAASWVLQLAVTLLVVLAATLYALIFGSRLRPIADRMKTNGKGLLYVGLLGFVILAGISLLLLISVIGIPVVAVILIALLVFLIPCLAGLSYMVGQRMLHDRERPGWIYTLAGSVLLGALLNIPLFGLLAWAGVCWLSIGLVMERLSDAIRKRRTK